MHEGDEPDPVVDLFDADVLSGKDDDQIDLAAVSADAAAPGDGRGPCVQRIEGAFVDVDPAFCQILLERVSVVFDAKLCQHGDHEAAASEFEAQSFELIRAHVSRRHTVTRCQARKQSSLFKPATALF